MSILESKVSNQNAATLIKFKDYNAYVGEKKYLEPTITGLIHNMYWDFTSSNEKIVKMENMGAIEAVNIGTATITATLKEDPSIVKTYKVIVTGIDSNQATGTKLDATQINEQFVLKANGELWKIHEKELKSEKIDTNVKKYVYEFVYNEKNEGFNYTLTQKTDGKVEYVFNGVKSQIKDAKDIYENGYLSTDGIYYTITPNGKWKKVTDNVKKMIGSFLIKNDGKTYTVTNSLVCDFEITDAKHDMIVDKNKTIWKLNWEGKLEKFGENFEEFIGGEYERKYKTTDGKIMEGSVETQYLYQEYCGGSNYLRVDKNRNAILNETVILSKVVSINGTDEVYNQILLREDGSTWVLTLNGEPSLKKVVEQSSKVFLTNTSIKEKPMTMGAILTKEALMGFDIKKLDVSSVVQNFKSEYSAKIYKGGKELTGKQKVSTGSLIELYNSKGELVKEYTALVYGDVTGSGNPSAKDALAIIKHRTGKVEITDELLLEAARITENSRKTGGVPNASDALAIVKAKLGKFTISF